MKYLYIIIGCLMVFILFRECDRKTEYVFIKPKIDVKPFQDKDSRKNHIIDSLKVKAAIQHTVVVKGRDRWHEAKHDTIPVPVLINMCDSALAADSIEASMLRLVILEQDSSISNLRAWRKADSTNYRSENDSLKTVNKGLKKEVRKQKVQKFGLLALWGIREAVGFQSRIGQ